MDSMKGLDEDDVVDRIQLAPDAGLVKSLGANHTLNSAIADLVDNSIDARATRVLICLLTEDERLVQVEVLDNGEGMDAAAISQAMRIGHRRQYVQTDLGHFGMGLKAASFGHSDVVTVWASSAGSAPVGRRIRRADFSRDFSCEVLSEDAARAAALRRKEALQTPQGTTVVWTEIRNAYRGKNGGEAQTWLSRTEQSLRTHLGVVFHRLIERRELAIEVAVEELHQVSLGQGAGLGIPVSAIDPLGYARSGHPSYPKRLVATVDGLTVGLECHIWPAKSDRSGFRIGGKPGDQFQGFFIYRNDRLLQAGGWSDTANRAPSRQLARVVLDDPLAIGRFVSMNSEKHGLKFEPIFHDAIGRALAADGSTFDDFLNDAETVNIESNKRNRSRKPAIAPDKGFAPTLRRIISQELPLIPGDSMQLRWRRMPAGEFLDIDHHSKTLWINDHYRALFSPQRGSLNDAPVTKALLYLLTHHVFEGHHLGAKDKDEISLWKSVLGAAVEAEARMREEG